MSAMKENSSEECNSYDREELRLGSSSYKTRTYRYGRTAAVEIGVARLRIRDNHKEHRIGTEQRKPVDEAINIVAVARGKRITCALRLVTSCAAGAKNAVDRKSVV